jgi:hypothetical protein
MKMFCLAVPYLLLVTFYSGQLTVFDIDKIKAINQSPYHGVGVTLLGAYDHRQVNQKKLAEVARLVREESKKDVWPWVFFNRFIGGGKGERLISHGEANDYFEGIKGIDLDNQYGALEEFYKLWALALKTARNLGSPGIIVDPEAYNNYRAYRVSYLSATTGKKMECIKERLRRIGSNLVDIAVGIYPDAVIWILFTGLESPMQIKFPKKAKELRSVTYIFLGMLERLAKFDSRIRLVDGGGFFIGYCYESLQDLEKRVEMRNQCLSALTRSYPNLKLGGRIALWDKPELKKDWIVKGKCGRSRQESIDDFKPLIRHLLRSYDFIWIYGASAAGYNPYKKEISWRYNKAIREVIANMQ